LADNKVKDLYLTWDLKLNLPDGVKETGTGGGMFKESEGGA